jgi:uncharacterized protein (TIGR00369 family)
MTTRQRHSKVVEWDDPAPLAAALPTIAGLEFLRAIVRGELPQPPILAVMGSEAVLAEPGHVEFRCTPDGSHFNPLGTIHGGYACTVLDSAAACAGQTVLPAGSGYTSIDLAVRYLRPVLPSGAPFTAVGRVVKPGRRVVFTEAELRDAAGTVVATATSSLLVLPLREGVPASTGGERSPGA